MHGKKILFAILILAAAGLIGYIYWSDATPEAKLSQEQTNQPLVGNDRDQHGCIGSAGYTWSEPKQKCVRPWEESVYESDEQELQYFFARKYGKLIDEVRINSVQRSGDYLKGGVKFGPGGVGEGGLFFATKQNSSMWEVVYDGNGIISCKAIDGFDFPKDMIPQCLDSLNKLKQR